MDNKKPSMVLQFHQFLNLLLLLILGGATAFLYLDGITVSVLLLFTLVVEHLLIYLKKGALTYLSFSSLSTAMGVMLMMVSTHLVIYMSAIAAGLIQKHFLQLNGQHFFNPSNFALIVALVLFYQEAHIVLGQLGDAVGLAVVVMVLGAIILWRSWRWVIPIVFTVAYLGFQYLLIVHFDPVMTLQEISHRFYSVSFILFICFMLTDPKTTPELLFPQVVFTVLIALFATLLDRTMGFRVQHLFLALFFFSLWVPLVQQWGNTPQRKQNIILTLSLALVAMAVIIFVEKQPPYYFDMNG